MNILLINHYAGSVHMGMEFRPYYLAKEWIGRGHNVSIVSASYSHLRTKNPEIEKDWAREKIEGIDYYWVKTKPYSGNGVGRAVNIAQFVAKVMLHAPALCREIKPDVVISSSTYPLDGYASTRIRKLSGAKYIHEVHDMWPASLIELSGMSKMHPFAVLNQIAENRFCKKADEIISIPPCTKDYFIKHGMAPEKFYHVPNGIVVKDWENIEPLPETHQHVIDRLKEEGRFIIGFTGSHNEAYGLGYLIDAVRKCGSPQVVALFVGNGYMKEELMEQTKNERDKFIFLDPVSKLGIPALVTQMDALYVSGTKDNLFKFGISMNKLTDAMMAGRPILYAANAPNNYVADYDCGISVPPRDAGALAEAIQKLVSLPQPELVRMGENGHAAAVREFDYKELAAKFLNHTGWGV